MTTATAALALMTRLDVRRRGDSLRCPHIRPGQHGVCVLLWDRDHRMDVTGHRWSENGFVCSSCAEVYRREMAS